MLSFATKDSEKFKEDHNDIDIDQQGTKDIIINSKRVFALASNKLDIIDEENSIEYQEKPREERMPIYSPGEQEEGKRHTEKHNAHDPDQSPANCEVRLGCHRVGCKCCGYSKCHSSGEKHDILWVIGTDEG